MIFDFVEIKETCRRYTLLFEDLLAGAALGIVWEKPGGAKGNYAGRCGNSGADILAEGCRELLGTDDIGRERSTGGLAHRRSW